MKRTVIATALMLCSSVLPNAQRADGRCEPAGNVTFICGVVSPEDLVPVPRSEWVVVSGYNGGAVHLASTREHSTIQVYPTANPKERFDKATYANCPGPIDPGEKEKFSAHGLAVAEGADRSIPCTSSTTASGSRSRSSRSTRARSHPASRGSAASSPRRSRA